MTDFFQNLNRHGISLLSFKFSFLLLDLCEDFCSSPSALFCFRMGCGRRRSSFFVSDFCPCFQRLEGHDWNYMNLFWNIVHVLSIENILLLSSLRRLLFLFLTFGDWSSFHNIVSDSDVFDFSSSDQYEVSLQFSIADSSVFHCFVQLLDHTRPSQSEVEQNSVIFDLYNPSKIASEGISLTVNSAWSHLTSKILNIVVLQTHSEQICETFLLLHTLRLHGSTHKSCKQFVFFVRIGRISELVALRHVLFSGNLTACWEACSRLT